MTIQEIENEIIEEFSSFESWDEKYEYLIDLGKELPGLESALKTDDRKVSGCQSQVWLNSKYNDGKVIFDADSDAVITKGLIALLIRVLSGQKPEDIINSKLEFLDKIGMKEHLSMTRANGLVSMVAHMKRDAGKFAMSKN